MKQDKDQLIIRFTPAAGSDQRNVVQSVHSGQSRSAEVYDTPFFLAQEVADWLRVERPVQYAEAKLYQNGFYRERITLWEKVEENSEIIVRGFVLPDYLPIYKASVHPDNLNRLVDCIVAQAIAGVELMGVK